MWVVIFSPVSELRAQCEVMGEKVLLWWYRPLQSEEGVVLDTGLPQVLAGSIVDHVETQQHLPRLCLCAVSENHKFKLFCLVPVR